MKANLGIMSALATALFAGGAAAQKASFTAEEVAVAGACTSAASLQEGATLLCTCAPEAMSGSVWGSMAYTTDSSVCAAALHAGAVPPEGGPVVLMGVAGQESYAGTTNNGITTRDWGSYGSSFRIAAAQVTTALATCGVMPAGADSYSCHCPAASGATGRIWGYGPYTADSDICTAARHNGYIQADGGTVAVLRIQGLDAYTGGPANGIEASNWGAYGSSITFDWNAP